MELLWEESVRSPDAVQPPDWRQEILEERGKRAASGAARFVEWKK